MESFKIDEAQIISAKQQKVTEKPGLPTFHLIVVFSAVFQPYTFFPGVCNFLVLPLPPKLRHLPFAHSYVFSLIAESLYPQCTDSAFVVILFHFFSQITTQIAQLL